MKKKLMTISLMIIIMFVAVTAVYAAEPSVLLKTSKESLKAGETFTITISAKSDDGINGIDGKISYDNSVIELQNAAVKDSNWSFLGSGDAIFVISNTTENITDADIYVLTFKVKDNAEVGKTAVVSFNNVLLDTNTSTDSTKSVTVAPITITIVGDTETNQNNNEQNNNEQNNNEQNNQGNETTPNNNQQNNQNNQNKQNSNDQTTNEKSEETNTIKKDETTKSESKLPNTGDNFIIFTLLGAAIIIAIFSYISFKKYKEI